MARPWVKVTRDGHTLTRRDWALIEKAGEKAGVPIRVMQGSWSNSTLSAGTHSGAGSVDLSVAGMTEEQRLALIKQLRKRNACAWIRSQKYGWYSGDHIHAVIADTPGLAYGAQRQVVNYLDGENGLADRGPDPHPRPRQRVFLIPGMVELAKLHVGGRGRSVRRLQRALGITVDGKYGPKTDYAVRKHQREIGRTPDEPGKSRVRKGQARKLGLHS